MNDERSPLLLTLIPILAMVLVSKAGLHKETLTPIWPRKK